MNNKLLKTASIFGYVIGGLILLQGFKFFSQPLIYSLILIGDIIIVVLIFVGSYRIGQASSSLSVSKNELLFWGIFLTVFAWIIPGLLVLLAIFPQKSVSSLEERLKANEKLYKDGLITKEECDKRRKKILEDI